MFGFDCCVCWFSSLVVVSLVAGLVFTLVICLM